MRKELREKISELLRFIYEETYRSGDEDALGILIDKYPAAGRRNRLNEKDNVLIIYPDAITKDGRPSIGVIDEFIEKHADFISNVHLLPFYPYTSDDGYAVSDYETVRAECGTWEDIGRLAGRRGLVFDFVINHVSSENGWLRGYLDGDPGYADFFIEYSEGFDTSKVVRPRPTPLFHEFTGEAGSKLLWTTFGKDQVDLNFGNFQVLLRICGILAEYLHYGARCIRLDAVCYLWKESGGSCCNMERTHAVIKLLRLLMDEIAPGALLLTQTNVPHGENLCYFGDGTDEAGLIYQFVLPPLVLQAILSQKADKLTEWAKKIDRVSDTATFLNFLGGHDGIGLRPVQSILTDDDRTRMMENTLAQGGKVSCSVSPDGSREVYELNTNYLSALTLPGDSGELQMRKTLAAHSILFSAIGVPAIYYHALFGSQNDCAGMEKSGMVRRINRQKFEREELECLLEDEWLRKGILENLEKMLRIRGENPAFSPYNPQVVYDLDPELFSLERYEYGKNGQRVLSLTNVSSRFCRKILPDTFRGKLIYNAFEQQKYEDNEVVLTPYGSVWLEIDPQQKK